MHQTTVLADHFGSAAWAAIWPWPSRWVSFAHLEFARIEDGTRARPGDALLLSAEAALDDEAAAHGLVLV